MLDILSYEFIQRAIWASLLISILAGVIGTFIVIKRLVFISGGISHAAFGGLGIFYYFGLPPIYGGYLIAVIAAIILGLSNREKVLTQSSMIGVIWAVGMAVGILFIAQTPGYAPNLLTYLFGNILSITSADIITLVALNLVVIAIVAILFKEIVAVGFDEEYAFIQGVPVKMIMTIFMLLIAITIVTLIRMVGVILVIALLTIPPMISLLFVRSFKLVILSSIALSIMIILTGLAGSYFMDMPTGPVIIVIGALVLGSSASIKKFRHH